MGGLPDQIAISKKEEYFGNDTGVANKAIAKNAFYKGPVNYENTPYDMRLNEKQVGLALNQFKYIVYQLDNNCYKKLFGKAEYFTNATKINNKIQLHLEFYAKDELIKVREWAITSVDFFSTLRGKIDFFPLFYQSENYYRQHYYQNLHIPLEIISLTNEEKLLVTDVKVIFSVVLSR